MEQPSINLLIQKYNELDTSIQEQKKEMRKKFSDADKQRLKARKYIIEQMINQKVINGQVDNCVYYLTSKEKKDPIDEEQLETSILATLASNTDIAPEKKLKKIFKEINKNRKVKKNVQLIIKKQK